MVTCNLHHTGNYGALFWGDVINLSNWLCVSHSAINIHSFLGASLPSKLFLKKPHLEVDIKIVCEVWG